MLNYKSVLTLFLLLAATSLASAEMAVAPNWMTLQEGSNGSLQVDRANATGWQSNNVKLIFRIKLNKAADGYDEDAYAISIDCHDYDVRLSQRTWYYNNKVVHIFTWDDPGKSITVSRVDNPIFTAVYEAACPAATPMDERERAGLNPENFARKDPDTKVITRESYTPQDNRAHEDSDDLTYRFRFILVENQKTADLVAKQLKAGADFSTLVKKYSIDARSRADGGKLEFTGLRDLDPEFANEVKRLKPGQYSKTPEKSGFGWFLIKLDSVTR
jgi:hypothetical protein